MRELFLAIGAVAIVALILSQRDAPQGQAGLFSTASSPRRSNCPPRPYYARSQRPGQYDDDPRWERVERSPRSQDEYNDGIDVSTRGSVTTVMRRPE